MVSDKTGTLTIAVAASSEMRLLTDIRHDYVRTFLRSNDDATTGDVQEIVDELPLLGTQSRSANYPTGRPPLAPDGAVLSVGSILLKEESAR